MISEQFAKKLNHLKILGVKITDSKLGGHIVGTVVDFALLGLLLEQGQWEKCKNLSFSAWDNASEGEAWQRAGACLLEATAKGGVKGAELTGQGLKFIFSDKTVAAKELPQTEEYVIPVQAGRITQQYNPVANDDKHWGIDIGRPGAQLGVTLIYPIQNGVVRVAEKNQGSMRGCNNPGMGNYGNYVIVDDPQGYTIFGHFTRVDVQTGQQVSINTALGLMGSTGCSDGEHVHVERHAKDATNINPSSLISALSGPVGTVIKR